MKTSKFFVPALLAATLVGGATFATSAFSAPHGGGHGGHMASEATSGDNMGGMSGGMGGCAGMSEGGRGYHGGQGGMGYHMGQAYNALTPEKRAQFDTMLQDLRTKMTPLRDDLYVKKQELRALQNATSPDVNAVSKTATEINNLRNKMRAEHEKFVEKVEKDLGIKDYYGTNANDKAPKAAPKK